VSDDAPLRVVVDPNVLVSAAIGSAVCRQVLRLAAEGRFELVTSPKLLEELTGVLDRDRFLRWRTRPQLDAFLRDVEATGHPADDPAELPDIGRDPADAYLVALVSSSGADLLCSGDGDLLDEDVGIEVLSPASLLDRLA
jgi:putative PIN family toxin of toxin-antitoxin system